MRESRNNQHSPMQSNRGRTESEGFLMPESFDRTFDVEENGIQMTNANREVNESSAISRLNSLRESFHGVHLRHGVTIQYYFLWTMIIYTALGTIILLSVLIAFIEDWTFLEAVYFCAITVTTVGFGDLTPRDPMSKLLTCVLIAASLVIIAAALTRMQHVIITNYEEAIADSSAIATISETPLRRLCVSGSLLTLVVIGSTIFLHSNSENSEGLSIIDSFYYSIITLTTVGYGDVVPLHKSGRIFTIVLVSIGPLLLGRTITSFVEIFGERADQMKAAFELRAQRVSMQQQHSFVALNHNQGNNQTEDDGDRTSIIDEDDQAIEDGGGGRGGGGDDGDDGRGGRRVRGDDSGGGRGGGGGKRVGSEVKNENAKAEKERIILESNENPLQRSNSSSHFLTEKRTQTHITKRIKSDQDLYSTSRNHKQNALQSAEELNQNNEHNEQHEEVLDMKSMLGNIQKTETKSDDNDNNDNNNNDNNDNNDNNNNNNNDNVLTHKKTKSLKELMRSSSGSSCSDHEFILNYLFDHDVLTESHIIAALDSYQLSMKSDNSY